MAPKPGKLFAKARCCARLYAAVFIALDNDIDPFMRAIHQQSEWAAWAGAAACRPRDQLKSASANDSLE